MGGVYRGQGGGETKLVFPEGNFGHLLDGKINGIKKITEGNEAAKKGDGRSQKKGPAQMEQTKKKPKTMTTNKLGGGEDNHNTKA